MHQVCVTLRQTLPVQGLMYRDARMVLALQAELDSDSTSGTMVHVMRDVSHPHARTDARCAACALGNTVVRRMRCHWWGGRYKGRWAEATATRAECAPSAAEASTEATFVDQSWELVIRQGRTVVRIGVSCGWGWDTGWIEAWRRIEAGEGMLLTVAHGVRGAHAARGRGRE